MQRVNLLFDKEIIDSYDDVHTYLQNGYFFDHYSRRLYPINFDAKQAIFDYHLPLSHLIKKYYPGIKVNEVPLADIKEGERYIYQVSPVFFYTYFSEHSAQQMADKLDRRVKNLLRTGKCLLVLNDSHEYALYRGRDKDVLGSFSELQSDVQRHIIIASGNVDNGTGIAPKARSMFQAAGDFIAKKLLPRKELQVPVYGFNYFEEVVAAQVKEGYEAYSFQEKLRSLQQEKVAHFICLNNVNRDFRTIVSYLVMKNSLRDKFHISHRALPERAQDASFFKTWKMLIGKDSYDQFLSTLPWSVDKGSAAENPWNRMPWQLVGHSFCWLVTETLYHGDGKAAAFFTEKTYKPVSIFMPFIMVGQPYALQKLRKEGYRTFDRWWDESYDTETDAVKRMEKIMDVVSSVCKLDKDKLIVIYREMEEVLRHNYNRLLQTTAAKEYIRKVVETYFNN